MSDVLKIENFANPMPATFPQRYTSDESDKSNALNNRVKCEAVLTTINPANTEEIVACYGSASLADVNFVLNQAQMAFALWSGKTMSQRAQAVSSWLDRIAQHTDDLAYAMTREQGKPLAEAKAEIGKALRESRQMLAFAQSIGGREMPARAVGFSNQILRRPRGVVLAIAPWNFPVLTPLRKIVPALITGNTVVLKPSEFTPAAAWIMCSLTQGLLPAGVLSQANGAGDVAALLVQDKRVAAITFTGSVETGKKVGAVAGENLTPVSLELGGKNAAIIEDVKHFDAALDAIVGAAFQCSGQRCTSISRVIVKRNVKDKVLAGLKSRLSALKAGDGVHDDVNLGPITTAAQLDKIDSLVQQAITGGATLVLGGKCLDLPAAPRGRFYSPTLLIAEDATNVAVQEEIFGPVLTLQVYDTDDEALALINDVRFGLTSAIFTDRLSFAHRFLNEAQSGMLHVNHGTIPDDNMPFVGVKASGLGTGSVGQSTLDFYTTEHASYIAHTNE